MSFFTNLYNVFIIIKNNLIHENLIFTHLTVKEKIMLMKLSYNSKLNVGVEIGSYLGASSCFIAAGIRKSQNFGKLFCIDTWENDSMTQGRKDTFQEFRQNTKRYDEIIVPLRGWSSDIAHNFEQKIDFLFIDGGHSYDDVKTDVDLWMPKLMPGALLVMHDSGWAEGVQRVINDDISPHVKREGRLPNM